MDNIINDRLDKFFDSEEYDLEVGMAFEYLTDLNQKIYIYETDTSQSNIDNLYHESAAASEIVLKNPIELYAIVEVLEGKNEAYNDNNTLRILENGNLLIQVLIAELKIQNCKPKYGDYVIYYVDDGFEIQPILYQIANPGNKTFENVRTWGGYKSHFRSIVCTPVDRNELNFEF